MIGEQNVYTQKEMIECKGKHIKKIEQANNFHWSANNFLLSVHEGILSLVTSHVLLVYLFIISLNGILLMITWSEWLLNLIITDSSGTDQWLIISFLQKLQIGIKTTKQFKCIIHFFKVERVNINFSLPMFLFFSPSWYIRACHCN